MKLDIICLKILLHNWNVVYKIKCDRWQLKVGFPDVIFVHGLI